MPAKAHFFAYFQPRKEPTRSPKVVWTRDDASARELLVPVGCLGFEYGRTILNFPPPFAPRRLLEEEELLDIELSFIRSGDVLLQTTRPPLDDIRHEDRKQVEPGNTRLERRLFEHWRRVFAICARSHVKLAPWLHGRVKAGFESRRNMGFYQSGTGGFYQWLSDGRARRRPPEDQLTAAFLLRVDEIWKGGPGLIGAFGMDGLATLVWAYRLRHDFAWLIERPGFSMVEMKGASVPQRPTGFEFARDWKIDLVIAHAL